MVDSTTNNNLTSFPKGRSAFMVIHGIGEQSPLETLDGFARGIIRDFQSKNVDFNPVIEHRISQRNAGKGTGQWIESFVRICSQDEKSSIDVHEYYWANLTEEKISVSAILQWARKTLVGTLRYYNETPSLRETYEKRGLSRKYGDGMKKLLSWLPILAIGIFIARAITQATRFFPFIVVPALDT